jgi:cellulose synthase (UDP-forming)
MANPKIGMVQSPQFYENTDEFIANGTAQAQEIFYKHVSPAKNLTNSAFCVGTNVLFRRAAIDQIGGIAEVGHSEDIWTSRLLHEKKWQTLFVNEVLAIGRAPSTIPAFFKQQLRWSKGGLSMLFLKNPMFSKNLTIDQRMHYFAANFFYLCGFAIFAYLIFPLAYLLFGVKSLQTESGIIWLLHYIPYFGLYYSLTWLLLKRLHISTVATSIASFYPYMLAFVTVIFGTKINWVATTVKGKGALDMQWIWPHVLIIILTLFALVIGWYNPLNFWTTFYNSVWAIFNMYLLIIFILGERRPVHHREALGA